MQCQLEINMNKTVENMHLVSLTFLFKVTYYLTITFKPKCITFITQYQ